MDSKEFKQLQSKVRSFHKKADKFEEKVQDKLQSLFSELLEEFQEVKKGQDPGEPSTTVIYKANDEMKKLQEYVNDFISGLSGYTGRPKSLLDEALDKSEANLDDADDGYPPLRASVRVKLSKSAK